MRKLFWMVMLAAINSCSLPERKLAGTYIDSERGDTLRIKPDKTYTFDEKLMNGVVGFTKGEWQVVNNSVQFTAIPKVLMGYGSKIIKDSVAPFPVFDFYLGDSQQPVLLDDVDGYKEGLTSPAKNVIVKANRLEVQKISFDSLDVGMQDFIGITLSPNYFTNNHYRVQIYPAERFYEFDRYRFRYKKNSLKNINTEGLPKAFIVLKKTG